MLLDLPVRGISCVYWMCVRAAAAASSRPPSTAHSLPPVLTPTGAANRMPGSWRVSETPLWSASKLTERERRWDGLPLRPHYRSQTEITFSLATVFVGGIKGGGGFNSSSGTDRIEFRGSRREWPPHTHRLLIAGCAISITFQCWVDKKIKRG